MFHAIEMKEGDVVEFASDLQTDKGPSGGRCVLNDGESVFINHSDIEKDRFAIRNLKVNYARNREKFNDTFWELA